MKRFSMTQLGSGKWFWVRWATFEEWRKWRCPGRDLIPIPGSPGYFTSRPRERPPVKVEAFGECAEKSAALAEAAGCRMTEPCDARHAREELVPKREYCFSACPAGKQGWEWFVWDGNLYDTFYSPIATGFCATKEETWAICQQYNAEDDGQGFASHYRARRAAEKRMKRTTDKSDAGRREYLWTVEWGEDWERPGYYTKLYTTPYRVVKRTAKFVYVKRHWESDHSGNKREARVEDYISDCYRLNREELEREGYIWTDYKKLYTDQGKARAIAEHDAIDLENIPDCLKALGLIPPCTARDVKRAYRRRSRECHPDVGGNAQSFVELKQHYERALSMVGA